MDVVLLSRLQFAAATIFHFLFVPLTIGLSTLVAYMETQYVRTGDETYLAMTKFWGKLFLINFAVGVVTGITLEFQFGTNWSGYSAYVGDVFGSLLAIEATAAFFLESTMIGVWVFGWRKLSKKAHATVMWLIAGASTLSAVWILIANGWMQHPVGFDIQNGRAELVSFLQVVLNKFGWMIFLHVIAGAFVLTAFFVMGISAFHLLKKQQVEFFTRSFKIALFTGFVAAVLVVVHGDFHAAHVAEVQPAKLAAMETLWETQPKAPVYLFSIPDEEKEANLIEIGKIPGLLSFLAFKNVDAEVRGLKEFPKEDRPPVFISSLAFKGMVGLGTYFIFITLVGLFVRNRLTEFPLFLKIIMFSIPLPYVANELGWILAEVGRQPWIVYGMMKTADAASPVDPVQVAISLAGFILVYGLLGAAGFYLMAQNAKKGPVPVEEEV
ncbi:MULTISPECIES: cytochrome ubiquinol oxidase subunit I [Desulfococcus]|jgi:cytochrome d ubiquinol oxidase subunit I|uniref:Cytochrome bd ubiquinol oxidase subunit I n=1 Tax=Desulfococcus multivorans DSM 2059 TaxID=1121405 RepID=S7UXM7_DESML|nr:cytochrome ubiquinol oxidase subunit I [Desulfococcus multivorans]AOY57902.1 CydA1: cytochrome d ubiquinol oxidase subunit alpha [Desulfococcus multivorans]AQV00278.1 cytochrome ubiquinol oxidase subunit I [Desulfococcus multivorans]EPR38984.1 cytochrome bd ubiquinol oxidase subunit I [Desulfococcus multivorans DSM 2059]MDX9818840.1 cytochrome ubiquinol oxidase subunit I [Desulfococcus multivorans]SJZ65728.1 cytochrome bd-I ubiquinol oxidase subunit 1 apoprotein [Desulfococcus multivorans D